MQAKHDLRQMKILIKLIVYIACIGVASACSCKEPPPLDIEYRNTDAVFYGKVVKLELDDNNRTVSASIKTANIFKGAKEEFIRVVTSASGATCGFHFQIGGNYLIYANDSNGTFTTNMCTRTKEFSMEESQFDSFRGNESYKIIKSERDLLKSKLKK